MMVVSGVLVVDPAHATRALEAMRVVTAATRQEEGCRTYEFWTDPDKPGRFRVFEEWESPADLQEHLASAHLADFRAELADMALRENDITRYEVSGHSAL